MPLIRKTALHRTKTKNIYKKKLFIEVPLGARIYCPSISSFSEEFNVKILDNTFTGENNIGIDCRSNSIIVGNKLSYGDIRVSAINLNILPRRTVIAANTLDGGRIRATNISDEAWVLGNLVKADINGSAQGNIYVTGSRNFVLGNRITTLSDIQPSGNGINWVAVSCDSCTVAGNIIYPQLQSQRGKAVNAQSGSSSVLNNVYYQNGGISGEDYVFRNAGVGVLANNIVVGGTVTTLC